MDKNNIRLIIWGLLFAICFACGVFGLSINKANQRTQQYNYGYQE